MIAIKKMKTSKLSAKIFIKIWIILIKMKETVL